MDEVKIEEGLLGLRPLREALGLTQGQLADAANLTITSESSGFKLNQVQVHHMESGRTIGRIPALRSLSGAIGCTADDLLSVPSEQRLREIKAAYLAREAAKAAAEASGPDSPNSQE